MNKFEESEQLILKFCKENKRIPTNEELKFKCKIKPEIKSLREYYRSKNFDNHIEYFRDLGYPVGKGEVFLNSKYISIKKLNILDLKKLIKQFIDMYEHFPKHFEFNIKNNLPSYTSTKGILDNNNSSFNEISLELGQHRMTNNEGYEYWLNKYKEVMINGEPLEYRDNSKFILPDVRWFITNCKNSKVKTYNDWVRYELNLIPHVNVNKEECIIMAKRMEIDLKRPLMYEDVTKASNTQRTVNIGSIKKHWKNMNDMKLELGMEIIQEDMIIRHKSKDEMLNDMQKLIDELDRLPTTKDIVECPYINNSACYSIYFGGINNVFIQLGYIPNKKCVSLHMTNEDIINIYKDFIDDCGVVPSYKTAQYTYILPSPKTVIRRFNCLWNEFIEMIGYTPNECRYISAEAKDGTRCTSSCEVIVHNYLLTLPVDKLEKETMYRDILDDTTLQIEAGFKRLDWTFDYN